MSKHVLLIVDSNYNSEGRLGEYGGYMGFDIDMSTITYSVDAKTDTPCYIAYAQYNKDDSFWWIASHTNDMTTCYAVCAEGKDLRLNCEHYRRI